MGWPEWVGLVVAVLAASAGSSVMGDLSRRNLDVRIAHVDDVQRAVAALVEYASLVVRRREAEAPGVDGAVREGLNAELRRSGDALEAAVAMVRVPDDLGKIARDYIAIGELFAAKDPEVSEADEREKFRELLKQLRSGRLTRVWRR